MKVERLDYGAIKRATPTPQGGLRLDAFPTRAGVLVYRLPDGTTRRELRHPDEVFSAKSLETLKHAPVTDLHPSGRVDSSNYSTLAKGHVTESVSRSSDPADHVAAQLIVQDAALIEMIDKGERKELSCGYACDLDETPGELNGERYDAVQRNIVYNHVAVGPDGWGRAGPTASLRLDGLVVEPGKSSGSKPRERKDSGMKTQRIDGVDYEVGTDAHTQAVGKVLVELDKAKADLATERKRADDATTMLQAEKDRADKAEAAAKPEAIKAAIARGLRVQTLAAKVGVTKADGKDVADADQTAVLMAIAKKAMPELDLAKLALTPEQLLELIAQKVGAAGASEPAAEGEPASDGDMPEEEEMPPKHDAADFRRRAAGRSDSSSSRVEREDYASSHERMLERVRGMAAPKERRPS